METARVFEVLNLLHQQASRFFGLPSALNGRWVAQLAPTAQHITRRFQKMTRRIMIGVIIIIALLELCGCTTKHLSVEQSNNNFTKYEKSLKEIADQYGYAVETTDNDETSDNAFKEIIIVVSNDEKIKIRMSNSAYDSSKGVESFSIDYTKNSTDSDRTFVTDLFVDLVNCISGKTITVDFCDEFLEAPEKKYSASKYGYQKSSDELVAKIYSLNFFEDWTLSHFVYHEEEKLSFGGLTLQVDH